MFEVTDNESGLDRLMSVRSVIIALDCGDRTLRRWIGAGKFPPPDVRIGRNLRWKATTVKAWIDEQSATVAAVT